ncbi:major Facilitator Superfamily protein [bacterium BMS3Bbin02]|nr:major Facilitator Superfamily protein [bacterium BMS3Bbin02]
MADHQSTEPGATLRRRALMTVVTFGIVSLLADIVYEGARSIIGPYLFTLGASAAAVGLISGLGEFAGYALRTITGMIADKTQGYWGMTIAGYGLTVVAVPLLGWVGRVDLALALVVAERLGKAIRSPARDTLIANAAEPLGRGWGFGIHEALDQIGAVAGPLLLALVLALRDTDYKLAFTILAVPGVLAMIALGVARRTTPEYVKHSQSTSTDETTSARLDRRPRMYLTFVFLSALGFAPFPLIAFHLTQRSVAGDAQIPLMFALAMAVDAVVALVSGRMYDRRGLRVLLVLPLLSVLAAIVFTTTGWIVWVGVATWGAVMGIQESTLRAAVGDLATSTGPATAYGIFNAAYGIALLIGGVALGALYEVAILAMVVMIIASQIAAAVVLRTLVAQPLSNVPASP